MPLFYVYQKHFSMDCPFEEVGKLGRSPREINIEGKTNNLKSKGEAHHE